MIDLHAEELRARRIELTLLPGGELDFDQLGRQSPAPARERRRLLRRR